MTVIEQELNGIYLIKPKIFRDSRGYFYEAYHQKKLAEQGIEVHFVQDNVSFSYKNTIRGLHFQRHPHEQAKLVSVRSGRVFDVVVDIRTDSPTYGKWLGFELTSDSHEMLLISKGFAHGFCVLSETAEFEYKCSSFYEPGSEGSLFWNDPELAIEWPISPENAILSDKDKAAPLFNGFRTLKK